MLGIKFTQGQAQTCTTAQHICYEATISQRLLALNAIRRLKSFGLLRDTLHQSCSRSKFSKLFQRVSCTQFQFEHRSFAREPATLNSAKRHKLHCGLRVHICGEKAPTLPLVHASFAAGVCSLIELPFTFRLAKCRQELVLLCRVCCSRSYKSVEQRVLCLEN